MALNKKKILKTTLLLFLVVTATAGFVGYKMWTKPHRNVAAATATSIAAVKVAADYESNETTANSLYLDKVLEVNGEVISISANQKGESVITLKGSDMSGVICTLEGPASPGIKTGSIITIKGICTGYLTDVVLVRCLVQAK